MFNFKLNFVQIRRYYRAMARRSDHTRNELRTLALAAAREVAESDGWRGLTARKVATRIGYSVGTLYNVFQDLDDMIIAVNGETLDALFTHLQAAQAGTSASEPEEALRVLGDAYIAFIDQHPNLWDILFEHRLPPGRPLPPWYDDKLARLLGLLERAIAPLFAESERAERGRAARVLWCAMHGICSLARSGKLGIVSPDSVDAMADQLIANYTAGLRTKRSPATGG